MKKSIGLFVLLISAWNSFSQIYTSSKGKMDFELTDHLGNIVAIVNDQAGYDESTEYTTASIISCSNYYPFGMEMPERIYSSTDHRYGYSGKEKDNELAGNSNSLDFAARIYDPRVGRWLSNDPLQAKFPDMSPYHYVGNNPIAYIDEDGREGSLYTNYLDRQYAKPRTAEATNDEAIRNWSIRLGAALIAAVGLAAPAIASSGIAGRAGAWIVTNPAKTAVATGIVEGAVAPSGYAGPGISQALPTSGNVKNAGVAVAGKVERVAETAVRNAAKLTEKERLDFILKNKFTIGEAAIIQKGAELWANWQKAVEGYGSRQKLHWAEDDLKAGKITQEAFDAIKRGYDKADEALRIFDEFKAAHPSYKQLHKRFIEESIKLLNPAPDKRVIIK